MKIVIKVSEGMTALGVPEERKARIPEKYRRYLNVRIGEYLHLEAKNGSAVSLLIRPAFFVDASEDENMVYLSQNTFDALDVAETITEIEVVEGITLGCDPECLILDSNNKVVSACDHGIGSKVTDVGHDGLLLEFRPAPSVSEEEVVYNLYNLVIKARHLINYSSTIPNPNDVRLVAKSYHDKVSVGFHLHFGIPSALIDRRLPTSYAANQIVKALDYYLAIPSLLIEGDDFMRRTAIHIPYGKPGEYRLEYPTLEYRVLGGHIMRHPVLALGALAIGSMVVEDVVSRIKICTNNFTDYSKIGSHEDLKALYPNIPADPMDVCKALCQKTPDMAHRYMDNILKDYEFMLTHYKHAHNMIMFINYALSKRPLSDDIEITWRTYYEQKQQGQMEVYQASN